MVNHDSILNSKATDRLAGLANSLLHSRSVLKNVVSTVATKSRGIEEQLAGLPAVESICDILPSELVPRKLLVVEALEA